MENEFAAPTDPIGTPARPPSTLREILPGYFPPDRNERRQMLAEGLVCLDTNVLLDFYRFTTSARDDLAHVLERLGDRLFVPFQVALEFQRRRIDAIRSQQSFFDEKMSALDKQIKSVESMTGALVKSMGTTDDALTAASDSVVQALRELKDQVRRVQIGQDVPIPADPNDEPVQKLVVELLDGRTGRRPSPEESEAWSREAEERYASMIPPGFADSEKAENGYGDYLLWREVLNEAVRRGLPVTLVTREEKPDWVRRNGALILGPRPELVEEMDETAGVRFALMAPNAFLEEARTALSVNVEESTLSQAGEHRDTDRASDDAFGAWLLAHPEVLGVHVGPGGTWRNDDLEKLLGPELLVQLSPFRSAGRRLPKTILRAAFEAKLLTARLERLRAAEWHPEELLDPTDDEHLLAELHSDEIEATEARLRAVMETLPGVIIPKGQTEPN